MKELICAPLFGAAMMVATAEVPKVGDTIVVADKGGVVVDQPVSADGIEFQAYATLSGSPVTLTTPAAVTGSGVVASGLAGSSGLSVTAPSYTSDVVPQSVPALIWANARLSLVREFGGKAKGNYLSWKTYDLVPVKVERDVTDSTADVQFHFSHNGAARAFKVRYTQGDDGVLAQVVWGKWSATNDHLYEDWDVVTDGISTYNIGPDKPTKEWSYDNNLCIGDLFGRGEMTFTGALPSGTLAFNAPRVTLAPTSDLALGNPITGTMEEFVLRGTKTSTALAGPKVTFNGTAEMGYFAKRVVFDGIDVSGGYCLPNDYALILTNNATFVGKNFRGSDNVTYNSIVIYPGCKLSALAKTYAGVDIHVAGGEFEVRALLYPNRLTLSNGGKVTGDTFRFGYYKAAGRIKTVGSVPCTINPVMEVLRTDDAKSGTFELEADLHMKGGISEYGGNYAGMVWTKTGPGTLYIEGTGTKTLSGISGEFTCREGAVSLGIDGALAANTLFTLAGGTLDAMDFTNEIGALKLTADSTLVTGAGSIAFKDSSAAQWTAGAVLNVTGPVDGLARGKVRFLKTGGGTGLTAAQLAAIRYNGKRAIASLDDDGWLLISRPGLGIIVR